MNDVSAAYLWGNLEKAYEINDSRLTNWKMYYMFYIKVDSLEIRSKLLEYLKENNILSVFHYVPLHSAPAGLKFGQFNGKYRKLF